MRYDKCQNTRRPSQREDSNQHSSSYSFCGNHTFSLAKCGPTLIMLSYVNKQNQPSMHDQHPANLPSYLATDISVSRNEEKTPSDGPNQSAESSQRYPVIRHTTSTDSQVISPYDPNTLNTSQADNEAGPDQPGAV
ncbi:hypothetical protein BaRGS_00007141, partial [Batillaria attramentaria]